jgi:hypothetical protein
MAVAVWAAEGPSDTRSPTAPYRSNGTDVAPDFNAITRTMSNGYFDTAELTLGDSAGWEGSFSGYVTSTRLALVKSSWWREAEPLLLETRLHLQVGINRPEQSESKVRVLAMTE